MKIEEPQTENIKKIIEQFKNKKVLVIGDIMLDKSIIGGVSRISPEAPVQVVKVTAESFAPGGAANVANNISGLGGKSFTNIHADETARALNTINPTFFRFRTLNILDNTPLKEEVDAGTFQLLTPLEILREQRRIISQLDHSLTSKFRNDHISNYTSIRSNHIGQDREKILAHLDELIASPEVAKWKHKELEHM